MWCGAGVRMEHELRRGWFLADRLIDTANGKAAKGHGGVLNAGVDGARLVRAA